MLVVLVTKDGTRWLRHCLLGLSRQTYPRLGVLAIDNGSVDGSGDVLEGALGPARVIRLAENVGFAGAVNEALRTEVASQADLVLLLHDDTVLAPDAISRMVAAAERIEGAGVVGPKVLDWKRTGLLRDIGMSTDRFGYPYSPLEEGEIDQGQYDRVREVLYVSSCAMLVTRSAWTRVGPPDERYFTHDEDLDFCWRARLAGFRVVVTPSAEALHRGASRHGDRPGAPSASRHVYHRERSALASMLKNYSAVSLLWVLPLYVAVAGARLGGYLVGRRFEDAAQILAAWGWNVAHLPGTMTRRVRAQAVRSVPDRAVRRFMAPAGDRIRRWASSARQVLFPVRGATGLEDEQDELRIPFRVNAVRFGVAHPVAVAWLLAVPLAGIAFRNLFAAPALAGGALAAVPSSPAGFFQELVSGLRHTGLGGTQEASPALGVLGVGSLLTLGSTLLLQKALLVGLPALAGVSCYRAVRGFTQTRLPAVVAAGVYVLSPVVLLGISEGRIPALVFMAGLPWLAARLMDAFNSGRQLRRARWIVGFGLGLALLVSFYPGAALAAGLLVACMVVVPPLAPRRISGAALSAAGLAGAAVLSFPVVLALLRGGGTGLADHVGAPTFASLVRLSAAPGPGGWALAYYLPAAAALGMVFATGRAVRAATWATLAAVSSLCLAWLAGAARLPEPVANPVVFIGVTAFAYALLVAIALGSVLPEVASHAFGHRQLGAGLLAVALAFGLLGQASEAARGAWRVGNPTETLPEAYPVVARTEGPAYRILWVGRWSGGPLSPPGGLPDGRVEEGRASVRFSVTGPAGASALDTGRPAAGAGYTSLRSALADVLAGGTRHGGALLSPFGIRFVVADPDDLSAAAFRRLTAQLDVDVVPAGGLVVLRVRDPAPLESVVPSPEWLRAARRPSFAAVAALPPPGPRSEAGPRSGDGGSESPRSLLYLSQQFDGRWRAGTATASVGPFQAFGWAVGFEVPAGSRLDLRFDGQWIRDVEVVLLALLWLGALWATRRPATRG